MIKKFIKEYWSAELALTLAIVWCAFLIGISIGDMSSEMNCLTQ